MQKTSQRWRGAALGLLRTSTMNSVSLFRHFLSQYAFPTSVACCRSLLLLLLLVTLQLHSVFTWLTNLTMSECSWPAPVMSNKRINLFYGGSRCWTFSWEMLVISGWHSVLFVVIAPPPFCRSHLFVLFLLAGWLASLWIYWIATRRRWIANFISIRFLVRIIIPGFHSSFLLLIIPSLVYWMGYFTGWRLHSNRMMSSTRMILNPFGTKVNYSL